MVGPRFFQIPDLIEIFIFMDQMLCIVIPKAGFGKQ